MSALSETGDALAQTTEIIQRAGLWSFLHGEPWNPGISLRCYTLRSYLTIHMWFIVHMYIDNGLQTMTYIAIHSFQSGMHYVYFLTCTADGAPHLSVGLPS